MAIALFENRQQFRIAKNSSLKSRIVKLFRVKNCTAKNRTAKSNFENKGLSISINYLLVAIFSTISLTILTGERVLAQIKPTQPQVIAPNSLVQSTQTPYGYILEEHRFPNGLQLILAIDPGPVKSGTFSISSIFRVGSVTEKLDPILQRTGFAHVFEHLMFRGTPRFPDGVFTEKLMWLGGKGLNAITNYNKTHYFVTLPKGLAPDGRSTLDHILDMEADRFSNLDVTQDLIDLELGAVEGELAIRQGRFDITVNERLVELLARGSPYQFSIGGTVDELRRSSLADLKYFKNTYYSPQNMSLILSGDIDPTEAIHLVAKYFGAWKSQTSLPSIEIPPATKITSPIYDKLEWPGLNNSSLYFGFQLPPGNRTRHLASLEVAFQILAQDPNSILYESLVKGGHATSVTSYTRSMTGFGYGFIQIELAPGADPAVIEREFVSSLSKLAGEAYPAPWIQGIKNKTELAMLAGLEKPETWSQRMANSLVFAGDYLDMLLAQKRLFAVNQKSVSEAAKRFLNPNQMVVLLLEPKPQKEVSK